MFKKKKNILKHSAIVKGLNEIESAKKFIPDWYKKTKTPETNYKKIKNFFQEDNFKLCTPFLEPFTAGYMITLSTDIAVEQTEGGPSLSWRKDSQFPPAKLRDLPGNKTLPVPNGMSDVHFVWVTHNILKIPKGYSFLMTHPMNRYDLPFITMTGIVDGDFTMYEGQIPFFISSTFEGVIPAGTPIMQILPFKTENWKSKIDTEILKEAEKNKISVTQIYQGWYKKNFWKRKSYD